MDDTPKGLDTPTLKRAWESGAYLHDGSAATFMDVITVANPREKHGRISQVTQRKRERLVAYLMQIDDRESNGTAGRNAGAAFLNDFHAAFQRVFPVFPRKPQSNGMRSGLYYPQAIAGL